eukprot:gene30478-52615_t
MGQFHPEEPHWYLSMIGVDPSHHGQGLGSALLKAGLQRCDADGLPAYLESSNPKNVPLYERFGLGTSRRCFRCCGPRAGSQAAARWSRPRLGSERIPVCCMTAAGREASRVAPGFPPSRE